MALSTNKGFTLLELITVIAIMAIIAAIAIPSFWVFMDHRRLNGAARMVMGDLLSARTQAVTENNNIQVSFLDTQRYQIHSDRDNDGDADPGEPLRIVNIQDYYRNVTMSSTTGNPIFSPRGTVSDLATVTFENPAGSRKVSVAITGRVRIY